MVTTQVVPDCEATCGPSVCGIYFNTNRITSYLEVLTRAISKIRQIRVKKTTHTAVPHVDSLSGTA